jgi:hypothetical protein
MTNTERAALKERLRKMVNRHGWQHPQVKALVKRIEEAAA